MRKTIVLIILFIVTIGVLLLTIDDYVANGSILMQGKNLFNSDNISTGYYVNYTNGNLNANALYNASDYIMVKPNTEYYLTDGCHYAFYDENYKYISGVKSVVSSLIVTPNNAKYIRFSVLIGKMSTVRLEEENSPTTSEPEHKDLKEDFEIVLPSIIYALAGQELSIYFDNIINEKDINYDFDVDCSIGGQFENYFRVVADTIGTYPITITVYKENIKLAVVTSNIIVTADTVGSGVNRNVLFIGDSTTANGICTQKLLNNFDFDVMDITLIGTQGSIPNVHEGRSGWTVNQYYTDKTSPFVFDGIFDFSQYMTMNGLAEPDYVIINLGINDTFSFTDDKLLNVQISKMIFQYQGIIDSIKSHKADIKIGLAVTIPPNYSQDAFGKDYGNGQTRWRYKRNNFIWIKSLIDEFDKLQANNIYLIPINTNLDTRYMGDGAVHPNENGYQQIADTYWYWLKYFEK